MKRTASRIAIDRPGFEVERFRYRDLKRRRMGCGPPLVSGIWYKSGGEPFVAVMQASDLRDGDDSSDPGWLDRAQVWAVLVE